CGRLGGPAGWGRRWRSRRGGCEVGRGEHDPTGVVIPGPTWSSARDRVPRDPGAPLSDGAPTRRPRADSLPPPHVIPHCVPREGDARVFLGPGAALVEPGPAGRVEIG